MWPQLTLVTNRMPTVRTNSLLEASMVFKRSADALKLGPLHNWLFIEILTAMHIPVTWASQENGMVSRLHNAFLLRGHLLYISLVASIDNGY